jgi:lipopolysaccharide export system permease protein
MKTLDRYIGLSFARGFLLVLVVLVSLFSFLELVAQLNKVGRGSYQLLDAFVFVGFMVPRQIIDLIAICALLGSIIGLGSLADKGELLAVLAAGWSVQRVCLSVLASGLVIMVGAGVIAEFVSPPLEQYAHIRRSKALSDPGILPTKHGFWARHGSSFIRVGATLHGGMAADLDIYEYDEQGRLQVFSHAREAEINDDKRWFLKDVDQRIIKDASITTRHLASLTVEPFLTPEQVTVLELPPGSLSLSDLYEYIRALGVRGQNAESYRLALWQKLALPLSTGAMILLSLPFVFGPPRGTTAGKRIMLGTIVGVATYLTTQIIGRIGLILDLHPSFTTMAPAVIIVGIAIWLIRRVS